MLARLAMLAALSTSAVVQADPITLRLGTVAPEGSAWAREGQAFARDVERGTEGRVKVKLYFGGDYIYDPIANAKGWTRAIDATTGKQLWARQSTTPMVAGVTPTAGDVILTGDLDGSFLVLDSRTGDTLYKFNTGGAVAGGVSTYLAGGKQYVAAVSGNSSRTIWKSAGAATVVVFGLAGQ